METNTIKQEKLKERLDSIDKRINQEAKRGYYESRFAIELGMWEKGKAIGKYRWGKFTYYQLEKETGRPHQSLKKWHKLYLKYPDRKIYIPIAQRRAETWAKKALTSHVSRNTGQSEWFTPLEYIEAARKVMGSIDTDPATTEEANKVIQAMVIYTKEDSGLEKDWYGNIWMNPPYSQPLVSQFCDTFISKYNSQEIKQGCVFINNTTETQFGQDLLAVCSAVCFPNGRVKFLDEDGKPGAPLQGQMVIYCGSRTRKFVKEFSSFGICLCAVKSRTGKEGSKL